MGFFLRFHFILWQSLTRMTMRSRVTTSWCRAACFSYLAVAQYWGPFAGSAIMTMTSSAGLYILSGVAHLSVALYVLFRIFRRTSAPTDQHITFSDALATAHTAVASV